MSRELNALQSMRNNDVSVTSYWGGNARGTSIQMTQRNERTERIEAVQLTREQVEQFVDEATLWLEELK